MTTKPDDKWKTAYAMIGRRLRWARELVYPSQAAFARAINVDKSTIAKIEKGDRGLTIMTLMLAAQKLRCSADFLLVGELVLVEPSLRANLVKRHPELLEPPPLPTKAPRPVFEPDWSKLAEPPPLAPKPPSPVFKPELPERAEDADDEALKQALRRGGYA